MKIGILTFHSQHNYGGVLQCWALQPAFERLGHEAAVIDRWLDKGNTKLEREYPNWRLRQWCKFVIRSMLVLSDMNPLFRVRRTAKTGD